MDERIKDALGIKKGSQILCAHCETCAGPGWVNHIVWVIIRDIDCKIRLECLQPSEQTKEIKDLFHISESVNASLMAALKGE